MMVHKIIVPICMPVQLISHVVQKCKNVLLPVKRLTGGECTVMLCIGYSTERDSAARSMNHRTVEMEYYNHLIVLSARCVVHNREKL